MSRPARLLQSPRFLLVCIAIVGAFLVQSGELGTSDTMHRLQTAHSFWTSEPAVFPQEYPEFGLIGRGGRLYSWYGIGQSLLMLPFDVAGTVVEKLPVFAAYNGNDPSVRDIVVSFGTNMLIAALTALVCLRLLLQFDFTAGQAAAGVIALFFSTTHLHYTQNLMENNYILLLTLTGLSFQYEWLGAGSRRALTIGSAALGLNLLTRLTTGLDLLSCAAFLLILLLINKADIRTLRSRALQYAKTALPIYAIFLLLDRLYQFCRFGSFFNTYNGVFAMQRRQLDPSLSASYPFEGHFLSGFFGPLISPEKSIFLFDPLLILSLVLTVLLWKKLPSNIKAFLIAADLLMVAYIALYAKYTVWSGDFAWGDRYVSTSVQLAAFLSVPLLIRYRSEPGPLVWRIGLALIALSTVIQLESLCFWLPLEIYQMETLGHPTFVIALRFKNIAAFALGRMNAWGLANHAMTEDPWDYLHITTWNFLPSLLRRTGAAPPWIVNALTVIWAGALGVLIWLLVRLRRTFNGIHQLSPHASIGNRLSLKH